jgi:hypothetical protein
MQTFLPYPDVIRSARCLDWRRLGKQRVEAFQILKVLRGESEGWKNHPAVRMWRGYEPFLQDYMNQMIVEWVRRGYRNTMKIEFVWPQPLYPHWWGSEEFHASHRSNLLRKDPVHYGQFGWPEDRSLPYVWPV